MCIIFMKHTGNIFFFYFISVINPFAVFVSLKARQEAHISGSEPAAGSSKGAVNHIKTPHTAPGQGGPGRVRFGEQQPDLKKKRKLAW